MNKNPYINALLAAAYIVVIVFVINKFTSIAALQKTLYIPMVMLGLLVFSVALMGFLFAYQALALYLDNKKDEALTFFTKTLGTFAVCLLVFVALLLNTLR